MDKTTDTEVDAALAELDRLTAAEPNDPPMVVMSKAFAESFGKISGLVVELVKGKKPPMDEDEKPAAGESEAEKPDEKPDEKPAEGDDNASGTQGDDEEEGAEDSEEEEGGDPGFKDLEKGRLDNLDVTEWIVGVGKQMAELTKVVELLKGQQGQILELVKGVVDGDAAGRETMGALFGALSGQQLELAKGVVGLRGEIAKIPAAPGSVRIGNGTDPGGRHRPAQAANAGNKEYLGGSDDVEVRTLFKGVQNGTISFGQQSRFRRERVFSDDPAVHAETLAKVAALVKDV